MDKINTMLGLEKISIEKVLNFLPYPFLVSEWREDKQVNLFVNEKFKDEIGYTIAEIPTLDDWFEKAYPDSVYREETINAWKERSLHLLKHEDSVILKARIRTKKKGDLWYEVKASISGPIHLVAFVNINEEIVRKEELRRLNENKSRTLSILSHDLRMPLGNLYSVLRLYDEGSLSEEEYTESVKTLIRKTFHLLEFLDTTLLWTRNNFDTISPSIEDVDIPQILDEILTVYEGSYAEKALEISLDLDKNRMLKCDREIISITLRNVISNAIKFTQSGFIRIKTQQQPGQYIITVEDSGRGMTKDRIGHILSGNYASEKGTKQEKGLGLGLKICQDMVKKVDGKIEIESEPGKGTTVRVSFLTIT